MHHLVLVRHTEVSGCTWQKVKTNTCAEHRIFKFPVGFPLPSKTKKILNAETNETRNSCTVTVWMAQMVHFRCSPSHLGGIYLHKEHIGDAMILKPLPRAAGSTYLSVSTAFMWLKGSSAFLSKARTGLDKPNKTNQFITKIGCFGKRLERRVNRSQDFKLLTVTVTNLKKLTRLPNAQPEINEHLPPDSS